MSPNCPRCGQSREPELTKQCYCRKCNREYSAQWRKANRPKQHKEPKTTKQKKAICRALSGINKKNGVLIPPELCSKCNQPKPLEMHHMNYDDPLSVVWICKQCHADLHYRNGEPKKKPPAAQLYLQL